MEATVGIHSSPSNLSKNLVTTRTLEPHRSSLNTNSGVAVHRGYTQHSGGIVQVYVAVATPKRGPNRFGAFNLWSLGAAWR